MLFPGPHNNYKLVLPDDNQRTDKKHNSDYKKRNGKTKSEADSQTQLVLKGF